MPKRILILCEAIAPPAYSPRVLTLAQYLQDHGWQCTILTEEYEQHEEIEDCPTDTVDINFVICDLAKLDEIISTMAEKLDVLGEDANVSLNFIFPEGQGTFLNNEGAIIDNSRDPSLIWEIRNGNVIKPDFRMVIFGDDIDKYIEYKSACIDELYKACGLK